MTDLIVVPQTTEWHQLKRLVLDSVSSPITRRVYNLGLDEFIAWSRPGAAGRLYKGDGERLASCVGSSLPRRCFHQRADHGGVEIGG